jgi:hypothetical protein
VTMHRREISTEFLIPIEIINNPPRSRPAITIRHCHGRPEPLRCEPMLLSRSECGGTIEYHGDSGRQTGRRFRPELFVKRVWLDLLPIVTSRPVSPPRKISIAVTRKNALGHPFGCAQGRIRRTPRNDRARRCGLQNRCYSTIQS